MDARTVGPTGFAGCFSSRRVSSFVTVAAPWASGPIDLPDNAHESRTSRRTVPTGRRLQMWIRLPDNGLLSSSSMKGRLAVFTATLLIWGCCAGWH